jgi:hypothetical protein
MSTVETEMAGMFGEGDRDEVGGRPRSQTDLDVAGHRLSEHGLSERGEREGQWILTESGRSSARLVAIS